MPFSLQAPEQIAMKYGGDKRKIAQAMQQGLIDPTSATLAGIFIDRMRAATSAEQTPQQPTVREQTLPVSQSGLDQLPVDEAMFTPPQAQQPQQPGMAAGGLMAFAGGGLTEKDVQRIKDERDRQPGKSTVTRGRKNVMDELTRQGNRWRFAGGGTVNPWGEDRPANNKLDPEVIRNLFPERAGSPWDNPPTLTNPYIDRQPAADVWDDSTPAARPAAADLQISPFEVDVPAQPIQSSQQTESPAVPQRKPAFPATQQAQPATAGGLGALGTRMPARPAPDAATAHAEKLLEDYNARSDARQAELQKQLEDNKLGGELFKDYKSQLEQEALQAGADKEQAKWMSMFKAELAIMSGKSQNAFANIGQGLMVGAEDYQKAYKDLRKADQARRKELAYIEQAQRAEDRGERDRADQLYMRAADAAEKRDQLGLAALLKAGEDDRSIALQWEMFKHRAAAAGQGGLGFKDMLALNKAVVDQIDEGEIDRLTMAMFPGISKMPAPGESPVFDRRRAEVRQAKINELRNFYLGGSGASQPQRPRIASIE